jgi:hypothetical protein
MILPRLLSVKGLPCLSGMLGNHLLLFFLQVYYCGLHAALTKNKKTAIARSYRTGGTKESDTQQQPLIS